MSEVGVKLKLSSEGGAAAAGDVDKTRQSIEALGPASANAAAKAAAGVNNTTMSAKALNAALRGVPAQVTDIVTGLASGQAPFTVLIQQGGQLKDMFGGIGPAAKAIGGYVVGLINPLTVGVAAAAGLAFAFARGRAEAEALQRAVILSGGAAGASLSQLSALAVNAAGNAGASRGETGEVLARLAESGKIATQNLQQAAEVAIRLARVGGPAVADTVAAFEALGQKPVEASEKLNEKYNYLTQSVYRQIRALEEQGRVEDAAALAQKSYADAMDGRTRALEANLGYVERAWNAVKGSAMLAWDAMLGVGRQESPAARVADLLAQLQKDEAIQAEKAANGQEGLARAYQARIDKVRAALAAAQSELATENSNTTAKKNAADATAALVQVEKERDKYLSNPERMKQEIARIKELGRQSGVDVEDVVRNIRKKYADKTRTDPNDDAAREQAKSYAQQYDAAQKLAIGIQAEAAAGEKLLPVEKALAYARATLTDAQARELETLLAGSLLIEKRTDADVRAVKESQAWAAAHKEQIGPIEERTRALAKEHDTAGLTEARINDVAIARLAEARALAAANDAHADALSFYDAEIAARRELSAGLAQQAKDAGDWVAGARQGARDYLATVRDAAAGARSAVASAARNMEDFLVRVGTTGKASIRDLANTWLAEVYRMAFARPYAAKFTGALDGLIDRVTNPTVANGGLPYIDALGGIYHDGGIAGREPGGMRVVPAALFRGAPRFHGGGIAGDEVPIIAKRKEGIFTEQQMKALAPVGSGALQLTYAPTFAIDARGAAADVGPMVQNIVEQASNQALDKLMSNLNSGGQFALATARRAA